MGRPKKNAGAALLPPVKKANALPGFADVLTSFDPLWDAVLKKLFKIARIYGFSRAETPIVEDLRLYENYFGKPLTELPFLLQAGQESEAAVRPSLLPSILRAYCERKVYDSATLSKWLYTGRTCSVASDGKLKEEFEFGFEILGNFSHLGEAQAIAAVWEYLQSLGLSEAVLEINHIGDAACQRIYSENLRDFLSGKKYDLCDSCGEHLKRRPLSVFRCANLECRAAVAEAPSILDFLDADSHKHFTNILECLDEMSVPYQLNPSYASPEGHSRTSLCIKYQLKGETVIIGEAGYHDLLMQQIYGKNFCSFGFVGNLKAVRTILEANAAVFEKKQESEVYLVPLGELAAKKSLRLFKDLAKEQIFVNDHFGSGGVKNQLKAAETGRASVALIMGQKEAMDEMVILRDVKSGMQEIISYDKIIDEVKKRLGR